MSPGKESKAGLPASVENNLPSHARDIYQKAHDNALEQYKDPGKRQADTSLEETANKVAWSAVKREYQKDSKGEWVKK